jgi:hypothetical protein
VVLALLTRGFEHGVVCVCALPTPTPCAGALRDVVGLPALMGDQAVGRAWRACVGLDRGARPPRHGHGPWATSQPAIVQRTLPRDGGATAMPAACCQGFDGIVRLPKGQALSACGMGSGRADTEAVDPVWSGQRTQRLMTGEVIAQPGATVRGPRLGMCVNPTVARRPLAVRLLRTVLGPKGLWR